MDACLPWAWPILTNSAAQVRSSKQDQIHNSIVSTLLALMDGLDSRGSVVVIGTAETIFPDLPCPGMLDLAFQHSIEQ